MSLSSVPMSHRQESCSLRTSVALDEDVVPILRTGLDRDVVLLVGGMRRIVVVRILGSGGSMTAIIQQGKRSFPMVRWIAVTVFFRNFLHFHLLFRHLLHFRFVIRNLDIRLVLRLFLM